MALRGETSRKRIGAAMKNTSGHRFMFGSGEILLETLLAFLMVASTCTGQQNPPLLQVTSPTEGTVVNP